MNFSFIPFLLIPIFIASCYNPGKSNVANLEAEFAQTNQSLSQLKANRSVCLARVQKFLAENDTLHARQEDCYSQEDEIQAQEKLLRHQVQELHQQRNDCLDCGDPRSTHQPELQ